MSSSPVSPSPSTSPRQFAAVGDTSASRIRPELLAPAGDRDCIRAAIENGADAVYFGLNHGFNARARATNFAMDELPAAMAELHRRGVKGYVTLNTLVFSSELADAEKTIRWVASAGADAVLVQDLGVVRLIREICPGLSIHASTQMTLSSAECIRVAEQLGVERVVLPRELSIDEIRLVHQRTSMPLEAFVHGALCVAYSGQCLTSESFGGRSANRGQCAQACRLPYELICDGKDVDLGDVKYLLSPQDLAAYELVPALIDAGVMSLKIEGRLKSPEYVANITSHYRQAIDMAMQHRPVAFSPQDVQEMELSFSRGFSPGWLRGCDHKMLVPGLSSAKRGVLLGEVTQVRRGRVQVQLCASIKPGDGIVFQGDRTRDEEQGGRVYEMFVGRQQVHGAVERGRVELAFAHGALDLRRLYVGQQVWKTDDPQLTRRLRKSFTSADPQHRRPVDIHVQAIAGQRLEVQCRTETGIECRVASEQPLQVAQRHPLTRDVLEAQLGRLGHSPYQLRHLSAEIIGQPMVPLSVLGALRRELLEQLEHQASLPPQRTLSPPNALARLRSEISSSAAADTQRPAMRLLCRSLAQLQTVLHLASDGMAIDGVMVDFQDIRQYRTAVELARQAGMELLLATPRIQKPRELGIYRTLLKHQPTGILVRTLSGLDFFTRHQLPTFADFSLNAANELSAHLLHQLGAQRITPSYDLNRDQLLDMVHVTPPEWLEVVIHQHMPMFHMEHCVFCAVLSPGTNKTNCGRPCDRHDVQLRDRIGMEHPLLADVGCRNTLMNATAQSAAELLPELLSAGIRHFRIELLNQSTAEIRRIVRLYRELIEGRNAAAQVWRELNATNRVGVTRGTLEERRNPLAIL